MSVSLNKLPIEIYTAAYQFHCKLFFGESLQAIPDESFLYEIYNVIANISAITYCSIYIVYIMIINFVADCLTGGSKVLFEKCSCLREVSVVHVYKLCIYHCTHTHTHTHTHIRVT